MKKVYIAHPLTGDGSETWGNQARNVDRYLRICAWATNQGYAVVSWTHHYLLHEAGLTGRHPDGRVFTGSECLEFYISRDLRLIDGCDELWICGPPSVSRGMQAEIAYAKQTGIIVERGGGTNIGTLDAAYQWQDPNWYPPGYSPSERPSPLPMTIRDAVAESHRTAWISTAFPPENLKL